MLVRTHIAINALFIILFLSRVSKLWLFVPIALFATILPDIDSGFSTIGRFQSSKLIQFFSKHRGMFHSFTVCIIISVILAAVLPVLALPFFLGYSLHLLADTFTIEGIRVFWPLPIKSSWRIRTGSRIETTLFLAFLLIDVFALIVVIRGLI